MIICFYDKFDIKHGLTITPAVDKSCNEFEFITIQTKNETRVPHRWLLPRKLWLNIIYEIQLRLVLTKGKILTLESLCVLLDSLAKTVHDGV